MSSKSSLLKRALSVSRVLTVNNREYERNLKHKVSNLKSADRPKVGTLDWSLFKIKGRSARKRSPVAFVIVLTRLENLFEGNQFFCYDN